jgi:hypothetical protein
MKIPERVPRLRWFTLVWTVCALVWVTLEGDLPLTLLFAVLTAILMLAAIVRKSLAGRTVSLTIWLLATAVSGVLLGLGSALLILFLMAIKTGLHAHGPEFSTVEVSWVLQQIPLCAAVGLVGGLGVGLLFRWASPPPA